MSQHSKFTDGKVLRTRTKSLFIPDLMVLLRGLESAGGHTLDDLRRMDSVRNKINDTLEAEAADFYTAYTDAANGVELKVAEEGITNPMAIAFLREQALRPVFLNPEYIEAQAPDVYLSVSDWTWAQRKWRGRENLAADADNTTRTLRIADVLDDALGYKNMADKTIAVEGEEAADG